MHVKGAIRCVRFKQWVAGTKNVAYRDITHVLVARTSHSQYRGLGFYPWFRELDPTCLS